MLGVDHAPKLVQRCRPVKGLVRLIAYIKMLNMKLPTTTALAPSAAVSIAAATVAAAPVIGI